MLLKTYALFNINKYEQYLYEKELKEQTIRWYIKDVKDWIDDSPEEINKNDLIEYKEKISKKYKLSTVNIKTIAINKFLVFLGHGDLKLNLEKRTYSVDLDNMITKEEYEILLNHTISTGRMKMYYLIRTLANTGIRASELRFVTVENVEKGKIRICILIE